MTSSNERLSPSSWSSAQSDHGSAVASGSLFPPLGHDSKIPLFELVNVGDEIRLDNVYQNNTHALKTLEIRNVTDRPILVKLRSNLKNNQIAFQLENENIADLPAVILEHCATNTVDWSRQRIACNYHFNELFNYVNHIDELELEPQQTRRLILAFLPDTQTDGRFHGDISDESLQDSSLTMRDPADDTGEKRKFHVTGALFFFGYYMDELAAMASQMESDLPGSPVLATYELSIIFRASVCQSVLWTDVLETGLNFDDCMLGETYQKEFNIQNKSDIELHWLLNTIDLSNLNREDWLQFTDAETGETLDYQPVPGNSSRRILLTFIPKEVGEFNYDLQLENVNDARNMVQARIHASVRSVPREESLVVSSGNVLDFGDCISGLWTSKQITLNNVGEAPVEVRFIPESAEVVFDIKATILDSSDKAVHNKTGQKEDLMQASVGSYTEKSYSVGDASSVVSTSTHTVTNASEVNENEEYSRSSSPSSTSQNLWSTEGETRQMQNMGYAGRQQNAVSRMTVDNSDLSTDMSISGLSGSGLEEDVANERSTPPIGTVESYTRIEDLVLRPGKERVIQVSYRPRKDASINDFNAGQLIRRQFRIILEYGTYRSAESKERKAIQCKARTCTSFVEVIPKSINFGDTDVGTLKSLPVNIFNRSDIVARVELQFTSKVLNCLRGEIVIQPRSYMELKLDLYPRKVNPEYRKQITLVNYLNRDNDQIIEVHSTNIDKNRVTFHSLFYRILTATGANFLDFGTIVLNSPSIRTFTVENIRNSPLKLEITSSSPDDLVIYTRKRVSDQSTISLQEDDLVTTKDGRNQGIMSIFNLDHGLYSYTCSLVDDQDNDTTPSPASPVQVSSVEARSTESASPRRSTFAFSSGADNQSTAYLDLATTASFQGGHSRRKNSSLKPLNKSSLVHTSHLNRINKQQRTVESPARNEQKNTVNGKENESATEKPSSNSEQPREDVHDMDGARAKRSMGITAAKCKKRKSMDWSDIAGKTRVPFEDLIAVLEHGSRAATPLFPKLSAEERFVRQQLAWRRELERLIEKGDLVRTSLVEVDPNGEEEVVIVFTPNGESKPHVQSAPKKQDTRIFLRLVEFDRNIDQAEFENLLDLDDSAIPVRELIIRAQLCRSIMDLGQRNINFGLVERNERHAKSIVLHNRSETPLLYAIRKSGSIASGNIILGAGRYGVVRAFGKREIDFIFEPSLAGPFMERLIVENIRDPTNDQVLSLKALVRKPSTFFIKSLELAFGPCIVGRSCDKVETIVLTNTNKQVRSFEIKVDVNESNFGRYYGEFDFVVEDDDSNALSKEAEEEIENLEQKLKIARRKDQPDKIKKYLKKLAKLRGQEYNDEEGIVESSPAQTAGDLKKPSEDGTATGTAPKESSAIIKKTAESVVFQLDPNATKTISVHLKVMERPVDLQGHDDIKYNQEAPFQVQGQIMAHEYKNTDSCKHIMYTATICKDEEMYQRVLSEEALKNKESKDNGGSESSSAPKDQA